MAKIVDPDNLNQGTEVIFDTTAKTILLQKQGNLTDDGVSLKALYSFVKEEWRYDSTLIKFPFPMIPITDEQFELYNDWDFYDSTSELFIRDGGWAVTSGGSSLKEFMNLTTLGSFQDSANDKSYYIQFADQTNVTYTFLPGEVNQAIQIYADAANGDFDYRDYFKIFLREQGKTFDSYDLLTEQNLSTLTYRKYALPLSNTLDANISASDDDIEGDVGATYSAITVTYYSTPQTETGFVQGSADFHVIIDAGNQTRGYVYEKIQYLLRQAEDIDEGNDYPYIWGQTADELLEFVGSDLYTLLTTYGGVFIKNYHDDDTNNLYFVDDNGDTVYYPYVATGSIQFNNNLQNDSDAYFWMFFTTNPSGDFGSEDALIVEDASDSTDNQIAGLVNSQSEYSFTFDYDNNDQGGRTKAEDADVTVVAIGLQTAQYVTATSTITRSKGQTISLVAPLERNYENPS
ncbi:MAG: hypothetical protein PVG65_00905 [Candidatus Thorarchaeota archaeon]|jgi:hypothetical protein